MPKGPEHAHAMCRVDEDGTETRMPTDVEVASTRLYIYGVRGGAEWETAERFLVDQHTEGEWEPGTYQVVVSHRTFNGYVPIVTVVRNLPLHPDYAKLPYTPDKTNPKWPARAYIHTLVSRYPGSTMELIAEHLDAFDDHYRVTISTAELTERTGYQPPQDWHRPVSPYAEHSDAPEDKR